LRITKKKLHFRCFWSHIKCLMLNVLNIDVSVFDIAIGMSFFALRLSNTPLLYSSLRCSHKLDVLMVNIRIKDVSPVKTRRGDGQTEHLWHRYFATAIHAKLVTPKPTKRWTQLNYNESSVHASFHQQQSSIKDATKDITTQNYF
jgi:hypothetical protein